MGYTADDFIRAANAMDIEKKRQYTGTEEKYQKHFEICNRLNDLYISKNKEYGDSFGKAYKEIGIMSGVSDIYHKVQRLVNITKNKEELKYESLEDTIIDLANYAVMLLTELEIDRESECVQ